MSAVPTGKNLVVLDAQRDTPDQCPTDHRDASTGDRLTSIRESSLISDLFLRRVARAARHHSSKNVDEKGRASLRSAR